MKKITLAYLLILCAVGATDIFAITPRRAKITANRAKQTAIKKQLDKRANAQTTEETSDAEIVAADLNQHSPMVDTQADLTTIDTNEKMAEVPQESVAKTSDAEQDIESKQVPYAINQVPEESLSTEQFVFDDQAKRNEVKNLVEKGVKFFNENKSIDFILSNFCNNKEFKRGEIFLFMYDMNGTCLTTGRDKEQIWQNMYNARDKFSVLYVREMINKANKGGGWISYEWKNGTKFAYVTKVSKNGKDYVLSCGYFPFSKETAAISSVKAAATIFNREVLKKGLNPEAIWGIISYKKGRFVYGDLYLYAVSFKGEIVAHGERSGFIGTSALDDQDDNGNYYNRDIITKLKKSGKDSIWVSNIINKTVKKTYARKVIDKKGNEYFIACGYFPEINKDAVVDHVHLAYYALKNEGLNVTTDINKRSKDFSFGDLNLFLYDMEGNCFIDSENIANVGTSLWDRKDEDGVAYIQEIINKAKLGGGWIDFRQNNSFKSCYVELVKLGTGDYAVGCGYYPANKLETMILLAKSAASFFRSASSKEEALAAFTKQDSLYNRGDLQIFVTTMDGICLAFGSENENIWHKAFWMKDDNGVPIITHITEAVKNGPGTLAVTRMGIKSIIYVEEVKKDGQSYIIGSFFNQ